MLDGVSVAGCQLLRLILDALSILLGQATIRHMARGSSQAAGDADADTDEDDAAGVPQRLLGAGAGGEGAAPGDELDENEVPGCGDRCPHDPKTQGGEQVTGAGEGGQQGDGEDAGFGVAEVRGQ